MRGNKLSLWMFRLALAAIWSISSGFSLAEDQKRSNRNADERRENQQVKNAKEDVEAAEKKLRSDQGLLAKAQTERGKIVAELKSLKQATDNLRDKLETQFGKALGWPQAHSEQQSAQEAYDKAAEPVLAKLKASPEYTAISQKLADAQAELEGLSTEDGRQKIKQKIAEAQKQLGDLQNRELLAVPAVKQAQQALLAAQKRLQEIRSKIDPQLQASDAWKAAEKNWQQTRQRLEQSEARILEMQRKLASDQAKLANERSELARAKQRDQQDSNKPKSKNKSKN